LHGMTEIVTHGLRFHRQRSAPRPNDYRNC
jgi:hypothetical protein